MFSNDFITQLIEIMLQLIKPTYTICLHVNNWSKTWKPIQNWTCCWSISHFNLGLIMKRMIPDCYGHQISLTVDRLGEKTISDQSDLYLSAPTVRHISISTIEYQGRSHFLSRVRYRGSTCTATVELNIEDQHTLQKGELRVMRQQQRVQKYSSIVVFIYNQHKSSLYWEEERKK